MAELERLRSNGGRQEGEAEKAGVDGVFGQRGQKDEYHMLEGLRRLLASSQMMRS